MKHNGRRVASIFIATFVVMIMLGTTIVIASPVTGTRTGTVYDLDTWNPVYNAHVYFPTLGIGAYTDSSGQYSISYSVEPGYYKMEIDHPGHVTYTTTLAALAGGTTSYSYVLPRAAGVSGYVYDTGSSPSPVGGETVGLAYNILAGAPISFMKQTTTDPTGFYYMSHLSSYIRPYTLVFKGSSTFTHLYEIGQPATDSVLTINTNVQRNYLANEIVAALFVHAPDSWSDVTWAESFTSSNTISTTVSAYGSVFYGVGGSQTYSFSTTRTWSDQTTTDKGWVAYNQIRITGTAIWNSNLGKYDILNAYPVSSTPENFLLASNQVHNINEPSPQQTNYPLTNGHIISFANNGQNEHSDGFDVSVGLSGQYFSTTLVTLSTMRTDTSSTTTDLTINFSVSGGGSHQYRTYYETGSGFIVDIFGS